MAAAATAFAPLLASLRRELQEEAGMVAARPGRGCPECGKLCTIFWGRNSNAFIVIHHRMPCKLRYETLGVGATEEAAWQNLTAVSDVLFTDHDQALPL